MGKQQQSLFQIDAPAWEIDDASEAYVATVVFSETPYGPFDYAIPERLRASVSTGRRVRVPLGRGERTLTGFCVKLEHRCAGGRPLKEIHNMVDDRPLLMPGMLRLTEWMADYYLAPVGDALSLAVGRALTTSSQRVVVLHAAETAGVLGAAGG